ncbi:lipopolysaccharide exporter [Oxalobacteraceae bacterium GrIS 2.11]
MPSSGEKQHKAASAVKWAAAGTVSKTALQLGAQVVLARLLGPEVYGLFAMGMVVLAFSNFLADFGFSWSLVQNQNLTDEDIRFAFTWQLISGTAATVALVLLAPWIASYFNEPRLELIVRWLSLNCLLNAITAPASNLLRRKMDFRLVNIIQIVSYVIGYLCIGIPLAYAGAGVWTLVSAWLGQSVTAFILTMIANPHSVKPLFWYPGARNSTNVGSTVFVTNLCNWLLTSLDRVFLGRYLNAQAVGIYTVGFNLANQPNSLFLSALQPAFLAAGARLQNDRPRLRDAYLSVIATTWIIIAPMFVLMAFCANDFVVVLYGSKWTSSGPVLAILAISMPAYITWGMSTPILWNTEGKHLETLLQIPVLCVSALMLYLYAQQGVMVVATITAFTMLARALVIGSTACLRLKITVADLFPTMARGVTICLICAVGTYAGGLLGHTISEHSLLPFVLEVVIGAGSVTAIAFLYPRLLGSQVVGVLSKFSPPIPVRLNLYLRNRCSVG